MWPHSSKWTRDAQALDAYTTSKDPRSWAPVAGRFIVQATGTGRSGRNRRRPGRTRTKLMLDRPSTPRLDDAQKARLLRRTRPSSISPQDSAPIVR